MLMKNKHRKLRLGEKTIQHCCYRSALFNFFISWYTYTNSKILQHTKNYIFCLTKDKA